MKNSYSTFIYRAYTYLLSGDTLNITFDFQVGDLLFKPKIAIKNFPQNALDSFSKDELDFYIFNLGLCEIPSYWKATLSPKIKIEAGYLDEIQINFWRKLIRKGMGEFFFRNGISPFAPEFVMANNIGRRMIENHWEADDQMSVLVPVGGGKDSIVTLELASKATDKITLFTLGDDEASQKTISVFNKLHGQVNHYHVERTLDEKLLNLDPKIFFNGHTPFSSLVAFHALFAARLLNIKYILLSNEQSANEATGIHNGESVNHQYSKTFEFEADFRRYVSMSILSAPDYFSFLRPYYEIQIMEIFCSYPEYLHVFRSCNVGKKQNQWCGRCAKCLFVYILLSAFLDQKQTLAVFGKNLLDDLALKPMLETLTGVKPMKAFECVGTRLETKLGLFLIWKKLKTAKLPLPKLLLNLDADFKREEPALDRDVEKILSSFDPHHFVPEAFFLGVLKT